ncbi:YggS family pyridoxal phosphate-dependent enzyme [Brockia lithotrophica]|uniref:Pyridoxal phosphate homeostasis protein n=1 Tax=Brockia lithotrophica TaxID=933949 RepID=A0A660L7Z5_9BACL|nr:YggS family pyridoxal phosphate-dependent enzyme [Brockia lithotrophica]RKQ88952.1 hypothetical protein C7438_0605 [Brockia lithotrophica]
MTDWEGPTERGFRPEDEVRVEVSREELARRLASVRAAIEEACLRAGRPAECARLLLASKNAAPAQIRAAYELGARLFGENRAQELKAKAPVLADLAIEWHFIGHLQTNKVRDVLRYASVVESLDRPALAEELHRRLQREGRTLDVYVEVNVSGEPTKHGLSPDEVPAFFDQLARYPTLVVRGLMTLGPNAEDEARARRAFRTLYELRERLRREGYPNAPLEELSMGMSRDFPWAILEGATLVRIGTAVFGPRLP